ncbi:MAG: hypothetical protein JXA01_00110 [Dehalococcoidia bacterium]|nr:hypothetical protein [Dehalococcoidia bacterium]
MTGPTINSIESKLLSSMQNGFPLIKEPFYEIGIRLGITETEVIKLTGILKEKGIIRQISPVLDARKIGYQSTLIAMKVPAEKRGVAERCLFEHSGISHAYERDHEHNIWFTLSLPVKTDMQVEIQKLSDRIEAESTLALPAVRVYKLRTNFDLEEASQLTDQASKVNCMTGDLKLSGVEKKVINILQADLPLTVNPFNGFAGQINLGIDGLLDICYGLVKKGVIRRYGAAINHYKAGYKANAMTCWNVPQDKVESVATGLIPIRQVSHCYERAINPSWRYNFYVMVHANTKNACLDIIKKIHNDSGVNDFVVLFSVKEFKKTRIKYSV